MKFNGLHHVAICTGNMKSQIEFFTQVVGMELAGLFPMHGVDGALHAFLRMGESSYLSFVQMPGTDREGVLGISHAESGASAVPGGVMQHIAINVRTQSDLLELRDRLRSHGYAVVGPLDHDVSDSMYLSAPEGILLEFATDDGMNRMEPEKWVDPEVCALCGISEADVARYVKPPEFTAPASPVPQPDTATAVPPRPIPKQMQDAMAGMSDEEVRRAFAFAPPT